MSIFDGKKDIDVIAMRKEAEALGLFASKRGITIFYTTYLGMDIEEAAPKILKECELRDIPTEKQEEAAPPTFWEKADKAAASVNNLAEKYPIVNTFVAPMFEQILTAITTAGIAFIAGKKSEQNTESNTAESDNFDNLEVVEDTAEENITENEPENI